MIQKLRFKCRSCGYTQNHNKICGCCQGFQFDLLKNKDKIKVKHINRNERRLKK